MTNECNGCLRSAGQRPVRARTLSVSMLNSRRPDANRRRRSRSCHCRAATSCRRRAARWRSFPSASRFRRCSRIRARRQSLRERLEYVAAARDFASRELALPDNESYRSYADVGRPYVVWNVFATEEFSVEPRRWCFPIAGCVVYRGYFNEEDAQRYARRLRLRGVDTAVGGVAAYSTLGSLQGSGAEHHDGLERCATGGARCSTSSRTRSCTCRAIRSSTRRSRPWSRRPGLERWLQSRGRGEELAAWRTQRERGAEFIALLLADA